MRLSTTDLNLIGDRASTLSERLGGGFTGIDDDSDGAARRLARLKSLVAGDDPQSLATRINALAPGEMTEHGLLAALGPIKRASSASTSSWTSDLNLIVEGVARSFSSEDGKRTPTGRPRRRGRDVPYEHLYWPIAELAWEQVVSAQPDAAVRLDERARIGLQDSLVRRLSGILSGVLHPVFLAHRSFASSSMMQHLLFAGNHAEAGRNRNEHYTRFVAEQGENGLTSSFTSFPVAARLVAGVTRQWINFVAEFLGRLQHDEKEISLCFNGGVPPGHLIGIRAGLSDPHRGGRSVLILVFHGGLRLVYKPRPMAVDQQFYELVRAANAGTSGLGLRDLKILDQGGYGWMEFARNEACSNERAAKRYYQRAGALVCLTHWLQGIDFHRENVVAAGEHPLLLDLECLAHPLRQGELAGEDTSSSFALANSVLRTGLLPMWQFGINGINRYDNCGFNAAITQRSLFASLRWKEVNTDRMHWTNGKSSLRHSGHRAFLGRRTLAIGSYEGSVCAGYRQMARVLEGPDAERYSEARDRMYRQTSRRIKRPTFLYATVLRHSLHPAYLSDGVDRSIELLMLPCTRGDEDDWASEVASLERLDIPYFQYPARSKLVPSATFLASTGHSLMRQLRTVSASVRGRTRLASGKIVVLPHR